MAEQRNLTEENVSVLTKKLKEMQVENPDLTYRFFEQRQSQGETLLEAENRKLREELERIKNQLNVKDSFLWMQRWLEAYARKNDGCDVRAIMDWINQQPMTGG